MTARSVAGCVLIVWVVLLCGCGGAGDSPESEAKTAHLYQARPGDEPSIRMAWAMSRAVDPATTVAWLIYRSTFPGLAAERQNLIDVRSGQNLGIYDDARRGVTNVQFSQSFTYMLHGEQQTGDVDITYSREDLVPGQTYYYRARRVYKPNQSAPPISTTAASAFTVNPSNALSDASAPQGPVTYILPPIPVSPSNLNQAVDPRRVVFQWTNSTGADEYQVRVYTRSQANGQPAALSGVLHPSGTQGQYILGSTTGPAVLKGNTTYYWVVGARAMGEAPPTCETESGWLKSAVWQFRTAPIPPATP